MRGPEISYTGHTKTLAQHKLRLWVKTTVWEENLFLGW